jgi:hypothetical protein
MLDFITESRSGATSFRLVPNAKNVFRHIGTLPEQTTLSTDTFSQLVNFTEEYRTVQCCGSESEIIRMFWLDPNTNPKKSSDSDTDSDSDTVVG